MVCQYILQAVITTVSHHIYPYGLSIWHTDYVLILNKQGVAGNCNKVLLHDLVMDVSYHMFTTKA